MSVAVDVGHPLYSVAFASASNEILVAGGGGSGNSGVKNTITSILFQSRTKTLAIGGSFSTGNAAVMSMCWCQPSDNHLVALANNRCVLYYRYQKELLLKRSWEAKLQGSDDYLTAVSQKHQKIAVGSSDGSVHFLSFPSLRLLSSVSVSTEEVLAVHLLDGGSCAAVLTAKALLLVSEAKILETRPAPSEQSYRSLLLVDGSLFVVANSLKRNAAFVETFSCFDSSLQRASRRRLYGKAVTCLAVDYARSRIVFGTANASILVWSLARSGGVLHLKHCTETRRDVQNLTITSVATDSSGSHVFATSANGTLTCISLRNRRSLTLVWLGAFLLLLAAVLLKALLR